MNMGEIRAVLTIVACGVIVGCQHGPAGPREAPRGDAAVLDAVQRQTLRYFSEYAHPVSGLARERLTISDPSSDSLAVSDGESDVCTIGGSGFGVMALIAGAERGWLTRQAAAEHVARIVAFLEKADRFHGAFPHWLSGSTGRVIPFSENDDGGDLVETSFMVEGLLCAAEYFDADTPAEKRIRAGVEEIWRTVEWDWYTRGENVLYWHWSPTRGWAMNHQLRGWNEALITYVLAAASPTHPIRPEVYHEGWANRGAMRNGRRFMDIELPLGVDGGGPLFWAHYSFLGLDPRGLRDQYADYEAQNVSHARINHAYCAANPKKFAGYSDACWGLTASDNDQGYAAHSPTDDLGVISPTAALSSFPYTPKESWAALRCFSERSLDGLWGPCGFVDAFCESRNWVARSYLAIDQGPIVGMIENYRSQLLWRLFMRNADVRAGLQKLGFESPWLKPAP